MESIPLYSNTKKNLPRRSEFIGCMAWLKAICAYVKQPVVFALEEALMCKGLFLGRDNESFVYVYGNDSLLKYNGIVILGNEINDFDDEERDEIRFTTFNRTLNDSFANEDILDFQGITEAVSKYFHESNESFKGLCIYPEYQERFKNLAKNAIEYYQD